MADVVIRAEGLGKRYTIGHEADRESYTALRDVIARGVRNAVRKGADLIHGRAIIEGDTIEEVWALRGATFEVRQGEVIGVIGRNGAGKSTLLKILSRITEPSEGRATIRGRVASMLEVGTGFHPELSGRENIYLNGAILGMTRAEITRKFDEIVAFAEVEKFLDTPVKRYSSGMYVRLAFAVAAHLESEILIVDEVLAVGDAEFQRKCLGKMHSAAAHGRTVLFVSHNIGAIASLCSKGIYLKAGRIATMGSIDATTHTYLSDGFKEGGAGLYFRETDPGAGDEVIRIARARIVDGLGETKGTMAVGEDAWIEVIYELRLPDPSPRINLHLTTEDGAYAFASIENADVPRRPGKYRAQMHLPPNFLNGKSYFVSIYASSFHPTRVHVELKDVLVLNVLDHPESVTRQGYNGPFPGAIRPLLDWSVTPL